MFPARGLVALVSAIEKLKSWGDPRLALPRDVGSIPQFLEAHLYSDGKEERI